MDQDGFRLTPFDPDGDEEPGFLLPEDVTITEFEFDDGQDDDEASGFAFNDGVYAPPDSSESQGDLSGCLVSICRF